VFGDAYSCFQDLVSGARDAPQQADSGLPGPPCHPPGNDASLDCHLNLCSLAWNPSGLGEGRDTILQVLHSPPKMEQPESGKAGQLLRPNNLVSASTPIFKVSYFFLCLASRRQEFLPRIQFPRIITVSRYLLQSIKVSRLGSH
jgi:hypothetical protein